MEKNDGSGKVARDAKRVGATVATLAIIRRLCDADQPLRLIDVADALTLNRSTVHGILRTLVEERLVAFDAATKTYRMTGEIGVLAEAAGYGGGDVGKRLRDGMETLADRYQVNVAYWALRRDRLVLTAVADSPADIRIAQRPGQRVPLLQGAIGRIVIAARHLPDAEIAELFAETRLRTPQDLGKFFADVQRARERGWADDGGSSPPGTSAVAVAIKRMGEVVGACAALMMSRQYDAAGRALVARALLGISMQT